MDPSSYIYKGMLWKPCPTTSDNNSFFHSAFGDRANEGDAYFDKHAQFRRMRWVTFLTYFTNETMSPCLIGILKKCLSVNEKYKNVSIEDKQSFEKYIYGIVTAKEAVSIQEIPILATMENITIVVFSNTELEPLAIIKPNVGILENYTTILEKPKQEVILSLEGNGFSRLEPVKDQFLRKSNEIDGSGKTLQTLQRKSMSDRYKKGGSAGSKGIQYQVNLIAIVLLNALKNLTDWKLSTEDKEAGKFDDIVLKCPMGDTLIQSKNRTGKKKRITLEDLISTNSKNDDFSLPKYFLWYQITKRKFKMKNAIICTNADLHEKALTFLNRQIAYSDSVLYHEDDDVFFYTFTDKILPVLKEKTINYYQQNFKNKDVEESAINDKNLIDFLEHLQLYFNYPFGNDIQQIIENLLASIKYSKITSSEIYFKLMDWFQQPDGIYLNETKANAIFSEIWRDKYYQKLEQYNVFFQSNNLNFDGPKQIFQVFFDDGYLLHVIKIYRALQNDKTKILFLNFDDDIYIQKQVLDAFELQQYIFLIVICSKTPDETVMGETNHKLCGILERHTYKKVIFLVERHNKLIQQIGLCGDVVEADGSVSLEMFSKDSQDGLLTKANVVFQGKLFSLKELLTVQTTVIDYVKIFDSQIIEKLVKGEEIKVGLRPLDLDEYTSRYYVHRMFTRETFKSEDIEVCHEKTEDFLTEDNIYDENEKIILLVDGAGMGKSTVLIKLALAIKEKYPDLWVIKINLSDYTKFLRDSLNKGETRIDIIKLLDSKKATKFTNQLETFVFSMNRKIVLMLDGMDEISPHYTQQILSLLTQCRQAPNFAKIFVTTRPHMITELQRTFEVQPFVMHPFTKENQVDFLTNYWILHLNLNCADNERCKQYAWALIGKMSTWTKLYYHCKENDFAAIPLHLRMLAEIFQESIKWNELSDWEGCKEYLNGDETQPKLPERMNITELYSMFIEKKKDVYIYKGNPSGNATTNTALSEKFYECLTYHRKLALEVILDETECNLFKCYHNSCANMEANILSIGIIQKVNNEFHFAHRTFAEYFVADSLINDLKLNPNVEFQKFLIDEILQNPKFKVIRTFFDSFLQRSLISIPSNIFESYQSLNIANFWIFNFSLIHLLAAEDCVAVLQLILKSINFKIIKNKEIYILELKKDTKKNKINVLQFVSRNIGNNEKCKRGNSLKTLKILVRKGGLNIKDGSGRVPLHYAAEGGHLRMIKLLIEQGAKIDSRGDSGVMPLHVAALRGHTHVMKYLLCEEGINVRCNRGRTALHFAAERGQSDAVKYLVDIGGDINIRDNDGRTVLHFAAEWGQTDIVRYLVDIGGDIRSSDNDGHTILHLASGAGHLNVVKRHIKLSEGYVVDKNDQTVLHFAVERNCLNCIKYLVEIDVDVSAKDNEGHTAIHFAAEWGYLNIIKYLQQIGVDVNAKNIDGRTATHLAAMRGKLEVVKYLIGVDGNFNIRDNYGETPLHFASTKGHLDIVQYLLELGVDLNVGDSNGRRALHLAVRQGKFNVIKYLLETGVDVNVKDDDERSLLQYAVEGGRLNVVKYIVDIGGDVNYTDKYGCTALHLAANTGRMEIVKFFVECDVDLSLRENNGRTALRCALDGAHFHVANYLMKQKIRSIFKRK